MIAKFFIYTFTYYRKINYERKNVMQITPIKIFSNSIGLNKNSQNVNSKNNVAPSKLNFVNADTVSFGANILQDGVKLQKLADKKLIPLMDETRPYYTKLLKYRKFLLKENSGDLQNPIVKQASDLLEQVPYKRAAITASEVFENSKNISDFRYENLSPDQENSIKSKTYELFNKVNSFDADAKNFKQLKEMINHFLAGKTDI